MKLNHRPLFALAGLVALFPVTALGVLHTGDTAPDFSAPDTAGVYHSLSDFRGQVVVLNFWRST